MVSITPAVAITILADFKPVVLVLLEIESSLASGAEAEVYTRARCFATPMIQSRIIFGISQLSHMTTEHTQF